MMNRVPDRRKLRREYLRRKGTAYADVAIYAALFVPTFIVALGCGVAAVIIMLVEQDWGNVVGAAFIGVWAGAASWYCRKRVNASKELADAVPYVPPVTTSTLPADEILVRGAEQPATPSETLLRAAQSNGEAAPDQLLRVVPGTAGEQER